jgi:hypothetical protein
VIAITRPNKIYRTPTCHPNKLNSIITATSLIIGAAIKNENVIPTGIPVSIKPRKSGIAEHEQKGVTIPSNDAITLPVNNDLRSKYFLVFSGENQERTMPARKITRIRSRNIFCKVLMKNQIVFDRFDS